MLEITRIAGVAQRIFALLPDDAVLYIASMPIDPLSTSQCVCGRAHEYACIMQRIVFSGYIAPEEGSEDCNPINNPNGIFLPSIGSTTPRRCHDAYGGDLDDWRFLFSCIVEYPNVVEQALADRLDTVLS